MAENIEKKQFINATPESVFKALTNKKELERWFVQKADIDLRLGGAIRLEWAPNAVENGTILTLKPIQHLSYSWTALSPTPTEVAFDLTPENTGTLLHLTHSGIGEGEVWRNYYTTLKSGWETHFKNLTSLLETGDTNVPGPTGSIRNEL